MATEDTRICERCEREIFWNGHRWAGVYKLTDGDVCVDERRHEVHADHIPGDRQVVEQSATKVVDRSSDRVLEVKSVAIGIVNVFS